MCFLQEVVLGTALCTLCMVMFFLQEVVIGTGLCTLELYVFVGRSTWY